MHCLGDLGRVCHQLSVEKNTITTSQGCWEDYFTVMAKVLTTISRGLSTHTGLVSFALMHIDPLAFALVVSVWNVCPPLTPRLCPPSLSGFLLSNVIPD